MPRRGQLKRPRCRHPLSMEGFFWEIKRFPHCNGLPWNTAWRQSCGGVGHDARERCFRQGHRGRALARERGNHTSLTRPRRHRPSVKRWNGTRDPLGMQRQLST